MIRVNESLKLASVKIKTRKIRNIFSGCTVSLGIIIIMVILLGTSGVLNVGKKAFKNSNSGRFFALEDIIEPERFNTFPGDDLTPKENETPVQNTDLNKYKQDRAKYNIQNSYFTY